MTGFAVDAAWTLAVAFALSLAYEAYRATAKAGVSRHDSLAGLAAQSPLYVVAAAVIAALLAGPTWAIWVGLAFCVAMILVSIFYCNPCIMVERAPGPIDWAEDLVFTGLLFVAATMLIYAAIGVGAVG
ncbi:MAG: hypothetical protein WD336_02650 [Trueperaceae bacterium]